MVIPSEFSGFATLVRSEGSATVTPRQLLEWFGAKRRGSRVMERITAALEELGLVVEGALDTAGIDTPLGVSTDASEPGTAERQARPARTPNAAVYPGPWWGETDQYTGRFFSVTVPPEPQPVLDASRRLTVTEVAGIAERIRRHKVIPSMTFFPKLDGMKHTWWFHPLLVVAEQVGSVVAVDKNGCHLLDRDNRECNSADLSIPFGRITEVGLEQLEDSLWQLRIDYPDDQFVTLDEYVPAGSGCWLTVLEAILEVYMPVIEASRELPLWLHGAGQEGYSDFASWDELLSDGGPWYRPERPESTPASEEDTGDSSFCSGDMLIDLLQLAGVWPAESDPSTCASDTPLPQAVIEASRRLCEAVRSSPNWFEVPADLASSCAIWLDSDGERHVLDVASLAKLPGMESYPWRERGPLWYSSGMQVCGGFDGPLVFLRDGWIGVNPEEPSSFVLNSWSAWSEHTWPGTRDGSEDPSALTLNSLTVDQGDSDSPPGTLMSLRVETVVIDHGGIGNPSWATLSMELAHVVLEKVLPVAKASKHEPSLRHPPVVGWDVDMIGGIVRGDTASE